MKDGKFESHREIMRALIEGKTLHRKIGADNYVLVGLTKEGNVTETYQHSPQVSTTFILSFSDKTAPDCFYLHPTPSYYIPKDNSFAYLLRADGKFTSYKFDGTVSDTGNDLGSAFLSNTMIPVTKEQAERRVNSWWKNNDDQYIKIESGSAYWRYKSINGDLWHNYSDSNDCGGKSPIDYVFDNRIRHKDRDYTKITRAECEAAFRETFDFETAIKHLLSGKTVCRENKSGSVVEYRMNLGTLQRKKSDNPELWQSDYMHDYELSDKYWLAD